MDGFADWGFTLAAEDPLFDESRHRRVQPVNVAHPTAQHNRIRIENVHHMRQRFRRAFRSGSTPVPPRDPAPQPDA